MKNLLEKKTNGQIKAMISMRILISLAQYKQSYLMFVPNFKILVPENSLRQIPYVLHWSERRKKAIGK